MASEACTFDMAFRGAIHTGGHIRGSGPLALPSSTTHPRGTEPKSYAAGVNVKCFQGTIRRVWRLASAPALREDTPAETAAGSCPQYILDPGWFVTSSLWSGSRNAHMMTNLANHVG